MVVGDASGLGLVGLLSAVVGDQEYTSEPDGADPISTSSPGQMVLSRPALTSNPGGGETVTVPMREQPFSYFTVSTNVVGFDTEAVGLGQSTQLNPSAGAQL